MKILLGFLAASLERLLSTRNPSIRATTSPLEWAAPSRAAI